MNTKTLIGTAIFAVLLSNTPALARSASKQQAQRMREIPTCSHSLGTVAVVEPDRNWWQAEGLASPEAIIKLFVMRSGCFTLVDRNKGLSSRNIERALADNGELQRGSNVGRHQVRAADYFIVPDLITRNDHAGGTNIGGIVGGFLGHRLDGFGAVAGGINIKKKEANVTLTLVNARTTEQERLVEGSARKTDLGIGAGGFGAWWGGFAGLGASSYQNTEIGQVVVLAYLDAYSDLVRELGGLPNDASAAAPRGD